MSFDQSTATAISEFLQHSQKKALLIVGEMTDSLFDDLKLIVKTQTPAIIAIDLNHQSEIESLLASVSYSEAATFLFRNVTLDNLYIKHQLNR
jgi:hypothetical protein